MTTPSSSTNRIYTSQIFNGIRYLYRTRILIILCIFFIIYSFLSYIHYFLYATNTTLVSKSINIYEEEHNLYNQIPRGLINPTLLEKYRKKHSSSLVDKKLAPSSTSASDGISLTTTCNQKRKQSVQDNLWLSRSWAYYITKTDLPPEMKSSNNDCHGANDETCSNTRSTFRCSGDRTNISSWRTRSCHYQDICYNINTNEWNFYNGYPKTIQENDISSSLKSDLSYQLPTIFHSQPSQLYEEFIFPLSKTVSSQSMNPFDIFKDSHITKEKEVLLSSSKYRNYHGYVSLTTEPQKQATSILTTTPIQHDWAPTIQESFAPIHAKSTLYYEDLFQLYIPNPEVLYDYDENELQTYLAWMNPSNTKINEAPKKEKQSSIPKSSSSYRPSERPFCDPQHIQSLLYDVFAPLYTSKALLGLVTESDLTFERNHLWNINPTATCDDSSIPSKIRGSRILLLDNVQQEQRMQKLMYKLLLTLQKSTISTNHYQHVMSNFHNYFHNISFTHFKKQLSSIASPLMDIFDQCRNLLPLLTPAIDIIRETELINLALRRNIKNICFKNMQVGGYITYRFPDRIWENNDDDTSKSSSSFSNPSSSTTESTNKRTYIEALQQYPSMKNRQYFAHETMDKSEGLDTGNILYSNINFHRIPLLWEYRSSILLKYQLSPLSIPSHHQFVILEENNRVTNQYTISNLPDVYTWLHTLYPTVPIHRINLYSKHSKQWWENIIPILLNTTLLISNYGTLAQITIPFLPIGGVSIVIDLPVNSPYYSDSSSTPTTSTMHGKPIQSHEFMENHQTEFSGISYFRSLAPDAPLLNSFPHIQTLQYQIRTYEDIIEEEINHEEKPFVEETEEIEQENEEILIARDEETTAPSSPDNLPKETKFRIKLRKEKLLHLVERGLRLWELQTNNNQDSSSRSGTNIGKLYPHYGAEILN